MILWRIARAAWVEDRTWLMEQQVHDRAQGQYGSQHQECNHIGMVPLGQPADERWASKGPNGAAHLHQSKACSRATLLA